MESTDVYFIIHQLVKEELLSKKSELEKQISLLDEHHTPAGGRPIHNVLHQKQLLLSQVKDCFCQCGELIPKVISDIFNYVDRCHTNVFDDSCYNCMVLMCIQEDKEFKLWSCSCKPESKNKETKVIVPPMVRK